VCTWFHPRSFGEDCVARPFNFLYFVVVCFICLPPVSCHSNVANILLLRFPLMLTIIMFVWKSTNLWKVYLVKYKRKCISIANRLVLLNTTISPLYVEVEITTLNSHSAKLRRKRPLPLQKKSNKSELYQICWHGTTDTVPGLTKWQLPWIIEIKVFIVLICTLDTQVFVH
jgi:hypothetical protein